MKRDIRLVAVEETQGYSEGLKARVGERIWGYYWYDVRQAAHATEITPSRILHYVDSASSKQLRGEISREENDEIHELLTEANRFTEPDILMHWRVADQLPGIFFPLELDVDFDMVPELDRGLRADEAVTEYLRANDRTHEIRAAWLFGEEPAPVFEPESLSEPKPKAPAGPGFKYGQYPYKHKAPRP